MKGKNLVRSLVMTVLLASFAAGMPARAQDAAAPQASPFKDRAEYDAYDKIVKAAQAKDNNAVVAAADEYLAAYPESKMKNQTLQMTLGAYQALNNSPKVEETAGKILEIDPGNMRAILMLSYLFPRTYNAQTPDTAKLDKADATVSKGLEQLEKMQPAANQPPEQFEQQRRQTGAILYETAGYVALQKENYPAAQEHLTKSLESNPNNALGFYWLGLAYVKPKPPEYDKGLWALARSVGLTGPTALPETLKATTNSYLEQLYEARHGTKDGLPEVMSQASAAPFPPADFHVMTAEEMMPEPEPEPEPVPQRELTVKIEELATFDDIQAYLQAGGDKETDTWELLRGATLPLPGKVAAATPAGRTTLMVAVSPALVATPGKHDVELTLTAPLAKALAAGADVTFEGTLDSYTARPFLLKMIDGKLN